MNLLNKLIKKTKSDYFYNFISIVDTNLRKMWEVTNMDGNKLKCNNIIFNIVINNNVITDHINIGK